MRKMFVAMSGVLLGLSAAMPGFADPAAARAGTRAMDARVPLTIRTADGKHLFHVEVARTPAAQEHGLMFRTTLAPDAGMIFPFAPPRPASFWMRNTLIPLDMIFIRADGTIARVAANAVPHSEDTVDSGEPVAAVLEIAGGRAAALGIAAGDTVRWPG